MSDLPPPLPRGNPEVTDPHWSTVPPVAGSPAKGPSRSTNRGWMAAAAIGVAAIAGGVTYVATKDDGTAKVAVVPTVPSTNPAPVVTIPVTEPNTVATPSTVGEPAATDTSVAEPDEDAAVLPRAGESVPLGIDVAFTLPDGWTATELDPVIVEGETVTVGAQAIERSLGESPVVLMQEYIDTFDSDADTASYGPAIKITDDEREGVEIDTYRVTYSTFVEDSDSEIRGLVYVIARGDGRSAIVDIYGENGAMADDELATASAIYAEVAESISNLPVSGTPAALPEGEPAITSVHDTVAVASVLEFTPAPGYEVVEEGETYARLMSGTHEFTAVFNGQISEPADALEYFRNSVLAAQPDAMFEVKNTSTDEASGAVSQAVVWTGTNPASGERFSGLLLITSQTSANLIGTIGIIQAWPDESGVATNPNANAATFMANSLFDHLTL